MQHRVGPVNAAGRTSPKAGQLNGQKYTFLTEQSRIESSIDFKGVARRLQYDSVGQSQTGLQYIACTEHEAQIIYAI